MNTFCTRSARRARNEETGFTLIELVITVAILGIIAGGISSMMISSFRSQAASQKLLDTTTAQQQLAYWLPADMQSFGGGAGDIETAASSGQSYCGGTAIPGTRVLHLAWSDAGGATTKNFSADYAVSVVGGVSALTRYACTDGVASTQVLARGLSTAGTVANGAVATLAGSIITMRVEIVAQDGTNTVFQVSSVQRLASGAGALTGGGVIPTLPGPPVTCSLDTTVGPPISITPSSVTRTVGGRLTVPVVITVRTQNACGLLTANLAGSATPGVASVVLAQDTAFVSPDYEQWTATLDTAASGWDAGTFTVTIRDTGAAITGAPTGTLVVTGGGGCTVTGFGPSPASVGTHGPGKFDNDVVVTASGVSAACGTLTAAISQVSGGSTPPVTSLPLGPVNGVTQTGTLPKNGANWTAGLYRLTLFNNGTPVGMTADLDVGGYLSAVTQMVITAQPANSIAGAALPDVTVELRNAAGTVANVSDTVTIAIGANPGAGTLAGVKTVNAVNGVATFNNLSINKTGVGYTLVVTSGSLSAVTSSTFNITTGPAARVTFSTQPSTTGAGLIISPAITVRLEDQFGNLAVGGGSITLAIKNNPTGGVLSGTDTQTVVSGVATFNDLWIDKFGNGYTLEASSGTLTKSTSTAFNITAGVAAELRFSIQPANTTAGAPFSTTVRIEDAGGNLTTSTAAVTLAIGVNPGSGTLGGTVTRNATGGVATFPGLSILKAGVGYTLQATSAGLASATSDPFNITAGTPAKLLFSQQPSSAVAGAAIAPPVAVWIVDANDNLTTSVANVTMAIGTNPGAGTLSGTLTRAAASGVATFNDLSINKVGVGYTLNATSGALSTATSAVFTISAGSPAKLTYAVQPSATVTAGVAIAPAVSVRIEDVQGNLTTSAASVTVAIGTNTGGSTLGGTVTVSASGGVASFSTLTLNRPGVNYTLTAASTGLIGSTSSPFTVVPGIPAVLSFGQQPTSVNTGAAITPSVTVRIEDSVGNLTSSNAQITVSLGNAGTATLGGTTTITASNGVATFANLTVNKAGSGFTLVATGASSTPATSNAFNVTQVATKLVFVQQPTTAVSGAIISPAVTVQVQDAAGGVVTTSSAPVTLSIASGPTGGVFTPGSTVTMNAVNGVATFSNLSILKAGSYTVTATSGSLTAATSGSFTVSPGTPNKVTFLAQPPASVSAGATMSAVSVQVVDANGNVVTTSTASISLTLTGGSGGTLIGGTPPVNAVSGVATFSGLSINKSGTNYALVASSTGLITDTSSQFNVTAGTAAKLVFTAQPANSSAGASLGTVQVEIQDALGNLVNSNATINLALGANPPYAAVLRSGGTTPVSGAATGGVATFNALSLNRGGSGSLTLTASSGSLTGATSTSFTVTAGPAPVVTNPTNAAPKTLNKNTITVVTVTGNNFITGTSGSTLTLANGSGKCTAGAVNVVSSTSITVSVTTVGNLGTCNITVTNPDGQAVTVTGGINVV